MKYLCVFFFRVKTLVYRKYLLFFSEKKKLLSSSENGDLIHLVKEESLETVYFPKIFGLAEASSINFFTPRIAIRKFINSKIFSGSDFIITENGVIWDKYFKLQWTKIIPQDSNLVKVKDGHVWVRNSKSLHVIDNGFSLCGVHCTVWAHFIVQYLPKLYMLDTISTTAENKLTILLPKYKDLQIREIVFDYLGQLPGIRVLELDNSVSVFCKTLYHIENTSQISDNASYINPSDIIIPNFVIDVIKRKLVKKFIPDFLLAKPFRKIYIGRLGNRNLLNSIEVENYFMKEGFEIIYPNTFKLEEKIKIFSEAAIIVGPGSSGFTNVIFCQPGVKVLVFINYQRTFDSYFGTISKYFALNSIFVTGNDESDSIHSSYSIPIERISRSYLELLKS